MLRFAAALFLSLLVTACTTGIAPDSPAILPGDPTAPSQVTPSEALAIAQKFCTHSWRPFARNILHGPDAKGVLVNTPDISHQTPPDRPGWWIPGEANAGIPYKWGGFDDPASFDHGISAGHAGGDVSSEAKRRADNAAVSSHAVGVDCSGFVSRCLKLPAVHDTSQLPALCEELPSAQLLRPGDILNIPRQHVILCAGWAAPDRSWIFFYDTGGAPEYWKPSLKQAPLAALLELGYKPLRYRGMAREPTPSGKEVLTRSVKSQAIPVPNPTVGEP